MTSVGRKSPLKCQKNELGKNGVFCEKDGVFFVKKDGHIENACCTRVVLLDMTWIPP